MRLTLRTLLAYLDNTLDPQDAQSLRDKLSESGFATQLVQRIRQSLANGSMLAPSADAVGPVEEANVIAEYLDSTLPNEQVAEIERACLESDPHLAEAAACHQILTMILGQPAEVSPQLRARIYELPERRIEDIAAAGSFSSVAIPTEQPQLQPDVSELPTADATGRVVQPVGVTDSGVSDAPTRLRAAEHSLAAPDGSQPAMAGSRPRRSDDSRIYGGSIRPSRIAPWLVTLALVGILIFAAVKAFEPWYGMQVAQNDESNRDGVGIVETDPPDPSEEVPTADVPPADQDETVSASDMAEVLPAPEAVPAPEPDSSSGSSTEEADDDVVAIAPPPPTENTPDEIDRSGGDPTTSRADAGAVGDSALPDVPPPASQGQDAPLPSDATAATGTTTPSDRAAGSDATSAPATPAASDVAAAPTAAADADTEADPPMTSDAPPPPASELEEPKPTAVATVLPPATLLAGLSGDQWTRLGEESRMSDGQTISGAPTFRAQMATDNLQVTVVGPAQFTWHQENEDATPELHVDHGRILISASNPDATLNLNLSGRLVSLSFADVESLAAASVKHFRAPGFDPMQPEHRVPLAGILSVQGSIALSNNGKEDVLETGNQWIQRGEEPAELSPVEDVPGWIDPPDPAVSSLESQARDGLLELIKGDQPLEIALHEATLFRRAEVAALAARTLLYLGHGDIYFGGDGLLSEPKQRAYWPEHFAALLAVTDRSTESAAQLQASIENMDSAHAESLVRLLTGYSQKQLEGGADAELVELLDSPSMAVRVLALENLHKITGTTLYFRAEEENEMRRSRVIKKWVARLRKGDIRWPE